MKRWFAAAAMAALALPASAGMTYEFRSTTEGGQASALVGRASIEGNKMRMEFSEGDDVMFKDGSVVISADGGATLAILDTREKTYTELRTDEIFSALGAMMKSMGGMFRMEIENPTVNVREAGAGEEIEGYATKKYVIDASYDMVIKVMGMTRKTSITSQTDAWVTNEIGREFSTFVQQRGLKTGMEDFDELIDQQANAIRGFPLRQVIRTTTTSGGRSETSTTTMTVTRIREQAIPASQFEIPAGYEEVEMPALPFGN